MKFYLLLLATFLFIACTPSVNVFYDWDHDAPIDSFKTYSWGYMDPEHNALSGNHIMVKRVEKMIDSVLQAKGFLLVSDSTKSSDFKVVAYATVKEKQELVSNGGGTYVGVGMPYPSYGYYGYGDGFYGGGWYSPWWGPSVSVGYSSAPSYSIETTKNGSLIIDIVQNSDSALVWRGTGTVELEEFKTAEEAIARLQEIIVSVLNNFPPIPQKPVAIDKRIKYNKEQRKKEESAK